MFPWQGSLYIRNNEPLITQRQVPYCGAIDGTEEGAISVTALRIDLGEDIGSLNHGERRFSILYQ